MKKSELNLKELDFIELSPTEFQAINGGGLITDVISTVLPGSGLSDFLSNYASTFLYMTVQQLNLPPSLQNILIGLGRILI
ncbi:hypothetical protein [Olivibacter jilunii]|uniref:hypothetical protein n=1 Tax=Olivibacter jilunii TaxID=985016 RepID=UPI001030BF20|nr:hypothetical protein [Olivibacter jilunii]